MKFTCPGEMCLCLHLAHLMWVLQAFVNEKTAPEILDYQGDLVSRLQDQIQNQVHFKHQNISASDEQA